jgi:ubiquinone/menaquinone biosynthesis C-methylase UbiE
MLHVGMNIPDKLLLAEEAWRVLKPGGVFGIYDVMRVGSEDLLFPVPWATVPETPPPLGLHLLMGKNASTKVQNMIENISQGRVAPVELIAAKTG